jgi:hypothetical protein
MKRHRSRSPLATAFALALASPLLLQGCQTAMTPANAATGDASTSSDDGLYSPWPLKFKKHNLGIHCFDTYGCKVVYDGRVQAMDDPAVLQRSSASIGPDYRKNWLGGRLGFHNFPPPAEVSWRSKDGVAHEAKIDFGEIFEDELIRHIVPREDVSPLTTFISTDIHLEINDRTINVYMLASIPTREPQILGNRHSNARHDLILAHTEQF